MKTKKILLGVLGSLLLFGCSGYFSDMDIKSTTQPDIDIVNRDVNQYPDIIAGVYSSLWGRFLTHDERAMPGSNADCTSPGAGNWGLSGFLYNYKNYNSGIAKSAVPNSDPNGGSIYQFWSNSYSNIGTIRNMLYAMKKNDLKYIKDGQDKSYIIYANCYFLMGLLYTEQALYFDRSFVVTEDTELATISTDDIKSYKEIATLALDYLDKAIKLCDENSFTNLNGLMPDNMMKDSELLGRYARFMAARAVAYLPRNKDEQVDWNKVVTYLGQGKGLDRDIKLKMPNPSWFPWSTARAAFAGKYEDPQKVGGQWVRLNMRVVQMMADLETPQDRKKLWPLRETFFNGNPDNFIPRVKSSDWRLNGPDGDGAGADFKYMSSPEAASGIKYNGSPVIYSPYAFMRGTESEAPGNAGDLYCFMKAESDLLLAEAILRTSGVTSEVVTLINNTRTVRGGKTDITTSSTVEQVKRAIFYEKIVECGFAYQGVAWFERRRTDITEYGLTPYSFRQAPIPFKELKLWGLDQYTFGGKEGLNVAEENAKYNYVPEVVE